MIYLLMLKQKFKDFVPLRVQKLCNSVGINPTIYLFFIFLVLPHLMIHIESSYLFGKTTLLIEIAKMTKILLLNKKIIQSKDSSLIILY